MGNINLTIEQLNQMQPLNIVRNPLVKDKFILLHDALWGAGTGAPAYERESIFFNKILRDADQGKLLKATPFSIFTAFIDLAVCGLSLEPGARALCYLTSRNYNAGTKERPVWESRATLTISGYGELVLRERAGQIRHADNPVVVYANDEFRYGDRDGRKFVDYVCNTPHTNQPIVACYIRITRADGSIDYSVMLPEDWQRLAGYSEKNNSRWNANTRQWEGRANTLYTSGDGGSIDSGFLVAKCIKHAFKTYPKVRLGKHTELQSQQVDAPAEINDDFYGVEGVDPATGEAAQTQQPQPQAFGNPEPQQAGVTVNPEAYDDGF